MVRDQTWRRRKYEAKIDGTVAELRIDAYGDKMKTLHENITIVLVDKEERAKREILEPNGVATSEIPFYLNAMREFCRISRTFDAPQPNPTRNDACYDVLCRYRDKGLVVGLLYRLAKLCECYPLGYEYYDPW